MIFNKEEFESYFKFAIVRNPWDRLVSAFTFMKAGGINDVDRLWAEKHLSQYQDFDSFVKGWVNPESVYTWWHFRPQYTFVCDIHGNLMVDFVGLFRNLEEDFNYICRSMDIERNLLHVNKTKRRVRDYRAYYSEETKRIVENVYSKDIQLFDYSFDNDFSKNQFAEHIKPVL